MRAIGLTFFGVALLSLLPARTYAQARVSGTGSSFAAPLYNRWAADALATTDLQVNYQGTGSGEGQKQALAGTVDFGGSDAPMDAAKLRSANVRQFPSAVGGVDVMVNLPGIGPNRLRLNGVVLANIYLGRIARWNDPQIARLNPGLTLPNLMILPIHHGNASGTTFTLSRYLAKVSPAWKTGMGVGMVLDWRKNGVGAKGSSGTAMEVGRWPGSIGYAEHSYVVSNHLSSVLLVNRAGRSVAPNPRSFAAAVASADWNSAPNFAVDLTDTPGEDSWPIVTATFVLVPGNKIRASNAAVLKFFSWAFARGDRAAIQLQYVPLPRAVKTRIIAAWKP